MEPGGPSIGFFLRHQLLRQRLRIPPDLHRRIRRSLRGRHRGRWLGKGPGADVPAAGSRTTGDVPTLPLPDGEPLPLPCVSAAFATKTVPFLAVLSLATQ